MVEPAFERRANSPRIGDVFAMAACRLGYTVRYLRTPRFCHTLARARQDGSYLNLLRSLTRTDLLIFDDWMRDPIQLSTAQDLLEIFDDRFGKAATLIASQLPVFEWHSRFHQSLQFGHRLYLAR